MVPVLRCSNIHQKIPKPNVAFIRQNANKNEKESKAVPSHLLQSNCSQLNKEDEQKAKNSSAAVENVANKLPEEPTTCCMSGCANCVWLDYAEKMSAYYKDGGEQAIKEINEKVSDSNIRAFLMFELRTAKKGGT